MLIINSGIKRDIAEKRYHDSADSIEMFKQAGVILEHLSDSVEEYQGQ